MLLKKLKNISQGTVTFVNFTATGRCDSDHVGFKTLIQLAGKAERLEPLYLSTVLTNYFRTYILNVTSKQFSLFRIYRVQECMHIAATCSV